jgi:hypothetical protein
MVVVRSRMISTWTAGGILAESFGSCAFIWSTVSTTLAPGCLSPLPLFEPHSVWIADLADPAEGDILPTHRQVNLSQGQSHSLTMVGSISGRGSSRCSAIT